MQNFFNPKSVVIIGASNDPKKVGYAILSNLLKNSERKIFAVSLAEKEILGLKTFTSLSDIAEPIDLVVIAVRADVVPQILEECGKKKIPNAIVISAGFRETGAEGLKLEQNIVEIARKNNISLLGPNCLGVIDTFSNLNASFAGSDPLPGKIAFLSQSGALGTALLDKATFEGVGFSKFVSIGNEAVLNELDFLEYLANDENTSAILLYIEKLSDGRKFIELVSRITQKKPLVILKAGRSAHGQKAVSSHTGSLAPDDAIFSAACNQAGAILVGSIREFFNLAKLFQMGIFDRNKVPHKLTVLTNGGGPSVVATDLIDLSQSLLLAEIRETTKEKLRAVLPSMASISNPVDIIGDALSVRYRAALDILIEEKNTDAIIMIVTPQMMTDVLEIAKLVVEYQIKKTIFPVFIGGRLIKPALGYLKGAGISNFNFPLDLICGLDSIIKPDFKKNAVLTEKNQPETAKSRGISKTKMLPFVEMKKILDEFGINLPGIFLHDRSEIAATIEKIGSGPYTMKLFSPDVIHKTDSGAVKLNIKTEEDAKNAWNEILNKNPNVEIIESGGILMQKMVGLNTDGIDQSKEIIIGMKRDPTFGPTILFGLGGIFTEVLHDTALRVAPVSKNEAIKMISEIKGVKIICGLRGEPCLNLEALADIIVKLSSLALAHPEIVEVDFNPVIASPETATVVDARILVNF